MTPLYIFIALLILALPLAWWLGTRRGQSAAPSEEERRREDERWNNLNAHLQTLQRVIDDQAKTQVALEERTKQLSVKAEAHTGDLHKITSLSEQDIKVQEKIQESLREAQTLLVKMKADYEARRSEEARIGEAIRNLEAKLLGSKDKGEAGENLVADILSVLPKDMVRTGLRIKNAAVEFALALPNGKCIPIDSKMGESFEKDVRDVQKYIDPDLTESYAIMTVPDSRYNETRREHYKAFERGVYIVAYSMLLPYLLTLLQMQRRYQKSLSAERLHAFVERMDKTAAGLSEKLEGHMARGLVQMQNAHQESRELVGQMRGFLAQLKAMDETPPGNGGEPPAA